MTASDLFKNASLGSPDKSVPKPQKKHGRAFSVVEHPQTFKDFEKWSPTPEPKEVKEGAKKVPFPEFDANIGGNSKNRRKTSIIPYYDDDNPDINTVFAQTQNNFNSPLGTRRSSVDDSTIRPKKFFIKDIDYTLKELLENEDTDNNFQITTDDAGPKMLMLGTVNSNGFRKEPIRGTYMLSNLLQELTIARRFGMKQMVLDEARLNENPVERLRRLISEKFWDNLTREISKDNIVEMARDSKIVEETTDENGNVVRNKESHRIYIPYNRKDQYEYFNSIKEANPSISLQVEYLPKKIDAEYVKSINKKPGLLALSARPDPDHPGSLIHEPYVVPGGRFNELYGWDSYMETLGLLSDVTKTANHRHLRLARGMTENFIYEIDHYGKILNANRSYYLGRSQPPFLTDMTLRVFDKTNEIFPEKAEETHDFLRRATEAAIKEYLNIWFAEPRLDPETQLSCYHPEGDGIPPETESTHFESILGPYLEKHNLTQEEFIEKYNSKEIREPALDEYFLHDRAVRESGHDTSYRLEGVCAYLATVDLNSLLYKYEIDIAQIITDHFGGKFTTSSGNTYEPEEWLTRAKNRQQAITKYLWSEKDSMFYDYNVKTKKQTKYVSATAFWPLWAKVATPEQARKLVVDSTHKLEEYGGLVSGTLESRGEVNLMRPSRQWDYPFGWAPHQMLAWIGLENYGYRDVATRLAYRWLYMMIKQFVDYNGVVVEKYNVTKGAVSHKVDAEYGNQGLDFKGVVTEGFGWVNASYMLGLTFMDLHGLRCLGTVTPPELYIKSLKKGAKAENLE